MTDPLAALVEGAGKFQARLLEVKQSNPPGEFPWYPYDSIGNFCLLEKFLHPERRDLLKIFGAGPVLDLCCADGDLAFFLESLGCAVHAVDWPVTNMNFMRGVARMRELLGSGVEIHSRDLDSRFQLPAQYYTAAFFFGGLYHLKNPFFVLEELARRAEWCFLNTRVAKYMPDQKTLVQGFPVAYLVGPEELNGDYSNYWIFSESGLRRILDRAQWDVCDMVTFGNSVNSDPVRAECDERAFCLLRSRVLAGSLRVRLLDGWHELEDGTWRWTARRFSVAVSGIRNASARLVLPFVLPESVLAGATLRLRATANGKPLPAQSYREAGACQFVALLEGLGQGTAELVFEADLALCPDGTDRRERALIIKPSDLRTALQY